MTSSGLKSLSVTIWLVTIVAYLAFASFAWLLGSWLVLRGMELWLLRVGLWLLGLVAAGAVLWYLAGSSAGPESDGGSEIEAVLQAAQARLVTAGKTATGTLRRLPLVLFLGPEGSSKTTVIVQSGLDPELLAGEAFQGDRIGATPVINAWYLYRSVLLDVGGKFGSDHTHWPRIIHRTRPRTLWPTLTGRPQAPRAAVVCLSCEELLKPGGMGSARELRSQLIWLAQGFGVRLPVYVLFTKADRIPYFAEFVYHLSREEAQQVFGLTLRWPTQSGAGLYADREFQRLNAAFDRLLDALAVRRLDLLARETDPERRAAAYEFPRELRKIMPAAIQFLVDLCRPSQFEVTPVLRGAYFTGVRAVVVSDAAPVAVPRVASAKRIAAATQVFDPTIFGSVAAPEPAMAVSRKIPEWLFLATLLRDVVLRDRAAATVARGARHVSLARRAVLAGVAALSLVAGLWSTVAYARNRRAVSAATALTTVGRELPSLETLLRLETVRTHLERLSSWGRWGPYKGTGIYPALRDAYRSRLEYLLVEPARASLHASLDSLPASPSATTQYGPTYDLLKAYLMTTSNPERVDAHFLVPILMDRWLAGRLVDTDRVDLARRQFDYYTTALCRTTDCSAAADSETVRRARLFLAAFTGVDRIYQLMLSEAPARNPSVQFRVRFPDAVGIVSDTKEVPGAFTSRGWAAMQDQIRNIDRLVLADDWVLGISGNQLPDPKKLADDVRTQYTAEYISRWQDFLAAASVAGFSGARDAGTKLGKLAGNQSPLLQLLSLVSQNTNVDSQTIGAAFQPVHVVTPPGDTVRLVVESNKAYIDALGALQVKVDQSTSAPPGETDAVVAQAREAAGNARSALGQLSDKFNATGTGAAVGARVRTLLETPIDQVERVMGRLPMTTLNGRGQEFCREFSPLLIKYPFRPDAMSDASLSDVARFFQRPTGAVWQFYNGSLQNIVSQQATQFAPTIGAAVRPTQAFVYFFNRIATVTDALWPSEASEPRIDFTIKLLTSDLVPTATFTMDGQSAHFTRTLNRTQPYTWTGSPTGQVQLVGEVGHRDQVLQSFTGTWALFKLLQHATWLSGNPSRVQWTQQIDGRAVSLQADLNVNRAPARAILQRDYFRGLTCVSQIVP